MKIKKEYCPTCGKPGDYIIEINEKMEAVKGFSCNYLVKKAKCCTCGGFIEIDEIEEQNRISRYNAYSQIAGIISPDKILAIPNKYSIGMRPLSILLGWGEHTFTRFCEGNIPTRQYLDVLNKLYDDPRYYLSLLESENAKLISSVAIKKSKEATEKLIRTNDAVDKKIRNIATYILSACEDITSLSIQKALYYIQGFSFAFFGKAMFTNDCEAWIHGPIYRNINRMFSNYSMNGKEIYSIAFKDRFGFTIQEKSVIDAVIKYICCYSGQILEKMVHSEMPWIITRDQLPDCAHSEIVISKYLISTYFEQIKEKYKMNSPIDIKAYAEDMFRSVT